MSKKLSLRPNGSVSVRLDYEIKMGLLEPLGHCERLTELVDEVCDIEEEIEHLQQLILATND